MRKLILLASLFTCLQVSAAIVFVAPKKPENQLLTFTEAKNGMTAMGLNLSAFWIDERERIPSKTLLMDIKGQVLQLKRENFYFNQAGKLVWTGIIDGKPQSSVGLVLDGQRLSGTLYYDGQLLLLLNEANGNLWLKKGNNMDEYSSSADKKTQQKAIKNGAGSHFSRLQQ